MEDQTWLTALKHFNVVAVFQVAAGINGNDKIPQVFLLTAGLGVVRDHHLSVLWCTSLYDKKPCPLEYPFFSLSDYCLIVLTAVLVLISLLFSPFLIARVLFASLANLNFLTAHHPSQQKHISSKITFFFNHFHRGVRKVQTTWLLTAITVFSQQSLGKHFFKTL